MRLQWQQMRQQWRHANALDSSLVESLAKATSECEMVWRTARENRDIREIVPQITSVVTLVREKAQSMSQVFGLDPYECLLDQYEQGLRVADIDLLFSDLLDFLPGLLTEIVEKQNKLPPLVPLTGPFPGLRSNRAKQDYAWQAPYLHREGLPQFPE